MKMNKLNDWIYIFFINDNNLHFDRSVSRFGLGPNRAKQVVETWKTRGYESFYTVGTLPREDFFS